MSKAISLLRITRILNERSMSRNNTTVHRDDAGFTTITLHTTPVVSFSKDKIILNSGGYKTTTTKARMNQASIEHDLGIEVALRDGGWVVKHKNDTLPFEDGMEILR